MLNRFSSLIAFGYTIALAIVSLINIQGVPKIDVENSDKIMHSLAYALLMILWYWSIKTSRLNLSLVVLALLCTIYGIVLEVIQGVLKSERVSDIYDIIANCIGVLLAVLVILYMKKTKVKNA